MYDATAGSAVDPAFFIQRLYALPHGADFQDGGQHDCQEALRGILNALHEDLVRATLSILLMHLTSPKHGTCVDYCWPQCTMQNTLQHA